LIESNRSFCSEMNEIFMLIGKQFSKMSQKMDLSPAKFWVLMYLYRKEKATVNDLSNEVGTTSGATSLAIKNLEQGGYVVRKRDEVDRRVVWVCLTTEGRKTTEDIVQRRIEIWAELMQSLTDTEREILQLLLKKMTQNQTL
jgi:DNA-binding MarR family transcriptional regulator